MSGLQIRAALQRPGFALAVDMELPGRGVTALFGPSGSGKTTLLRILAGLEPQAQGRIAVQGQVWQDSAQGLFCPVHQRALGYVFQEANLFDHLSVEGNVRFGFERTPAAQRRYDWAQVMELMQLLGIDHLLARPPQALSGGERQRVAMARALATSPQLLLMDEPLAALDAPRKAEILHYLDRLQRRLDIPVLYVTHAIDEVARLADHLVLLNDGHVTAHGPTPDMLTRLDLPLAQGDTAGAVLDCVVQGHDDADHLTTTRFGGGTLLVPRQALALGDALRVRVQARDVSLSLQHQSGTSILNILPASVKALSPCGAGQVMVALDAGGCTLLARVTSRSATALGLRPGLAVYAQIKGVAILG
jgi:molybdate transport system ATP-binding protein